MADETKSSGQGGQETAQSVKPPKLTCPLNNGLMEDPVKAPDGFIYNRASIESYIDSKKKNYKDVRSPLCSDGQIWADPIQFRVDDDTNDIKLRVREILEREHHAQGVELPAPAALERPPGSFEVYNNYMMEGGQSVEKLGEVFKALDPLYRDTLAGVLKDWEPPQLMVVGTESSGKSTILERLCMMPLFPHDESLTTRMQIKVKLRRSDKNETPILQVHNLENNTFEEEEQIAAHAGHVDVRRKMHELIKRVHGKVEGITDKYEIVVTIKQKNVPNLDLLDLPGIVLNPRKNEPADIDEQTKNLVKNCIKKYNDRSIYLCVVDATQAPHDSSALRLLRDKGCFKTTIGAFSKCDYAMHQAQARRLVQYFRDATAGVELDPYGWVATMNASTANEYADDDVDSRDMRMLQRQAVNEFHFFRDHAHEGIKQLYMDGLTGTSKLIDKINDMFLHYLCQVWMPRTISKLRHEHDGCQQKNIYLGLPKVNKGIHAKSTDLVQFQQKISQLVVKSITKSKNWMWERYWLTIIKPMREGIQQMLADKEGDMEVLSDSIKDLENTIKTGIEQGFILKSSGFIATMIRMVITHAEDDVAFARYQFPESLENIEETKIIFDRLPGLSKQLTDCVKEKCNNLTDKLREDINNCIKMSLKWPCQGIKYDYATVAQNLAEVDDQPGPDEIDEQSLNESTFKAMQSETSTIPTLKVTFEKEKLIDDLTHAFASHISLLLNEGFKTFVERVVENTITMETVETCHPKRKEYEDKIAKIISAKDELVNIFENVSTNDEKSAEWFWENPNPVPERLQTEEVALPAAVLGPLPPPTKECSVCQKLQRRKCFSSTQWKKKDGERKCTSCV